MSRRVPADDGIIDQVAIERRMAGDRSVQLTAAERVELVRRWKAANRPLDECEHVTGMNVRRNLTGA